MSPAVYIALIGWIPLVMSVFCFVPPRRAAIICVVFAWLFLPPTGFSLPGLPDYSKGTAAVIAVLAAACLFDGSRLAGFRPSWFDLPIVIWCLCPFVSAISNDLGPYEGLSAVLSQTIMWAVPYLLGRLYITDCSGLRELTLWLFIGGLIYAPLCLFEVRMSPQLNRWVYGFGGMGISYRELGKWGSRPVVFMGTGLTLGLFMTAASVAGYCLWSSGCLRRLWGISAGVLVLLVVCTSVVCKNMGALVLLMAGIGCIASIRKWRTSVLVYLLIAAGPLYMAFRVTGRWGGEAIVELAGMVHHRRAESMQCRLENEDRLIAKALERPLFGWGRWGRSRVYAEQSNGDLKDITRTDGLWVIALGQTGLVGLAATTACLLVPAIGFVRRYPPPSWIHPSMAPAGGVVVLIVLYAIDNLFNAMLNPIYILASGGVVGALLSRNSAVVHTAVQAISSVPGIARPRARPDRRIRTSTL